MGDDDRRCRSLIAGALLALFLSTPAPAFVLTPATDDVHDAGQTLTVENEVVTVTLVSAASGFDDELGMVGEAPGTGIPCRSTPPGFTALLGRYDAPTEPALSLTTPERNVWTTGPGTDNADLVAHARLSMAASDTVLVEWEDMAGGGDLDYNDCVVKLRITKVEP